MAKAFEDLKFSDDYMFGLVMTDPGICERTLEALLGISIDKITYPERQKTIDIEGNGKKVTLDVYVMTEQDFVYDVEMQNLNHHSVEHLDLPERMRYYQSMIDLNILNQGKTYRELKDVCIVFICTFDPFGKGLYRYTFENTCLEDPSVTLNDKCHKIFINTLGTAPDISESTKRLLDFINTGKTANSLTSEISDRIRSIKENATWRREYMKSITWLEDAKYEAREEGLAEGRAEGKTLEHANLSVKVYKNCLAKGLSEEDAITISEITETELASLKSNSST